jgi:predicted GNAT family N-acyltransferase
MDVVEISAAATHDLRRRVLRNGTLSDQVVFEGDDEATTFHLGVRDDGGALVATSTWLLRPHPAAPDRSAHQLRGMAIEPALQGSGIGSRLLLAGLDACRGRGSDVVWAHARSTALAFYAQHGFAVCGDEYVEEATGLPHVDVVTTLGGSGADQRR